MAFLDTYLNDHLAGATAAVFMREDWSVRAPQPEMRQFFRELLRDVQEDHRTLISLVRALNAGPSLMKMMLASLGERLTNLSLRVAPDKVAGSMLEVLEGLIIGIRGKIALWDALAQLPNDPRFANLDLTKLRERATEQLDRVEERRLRFAARALSS